MLGQILGGMLAGSPDVPTWKPITPEGSQSKAVGSNLDVLPELQTLASKTNTFNQAELQRMLELAIPGYKEIQAQQSAIVQGQLGGELTKDEINAMQRNAAKFGIASGAGVGSGFTTNRTLRDLGISTLQRQQLGLNNAQQWIRQTAAMTTPNMFNMTSMFLTPESVFQMDFQNQTAQFQRDWTQNQLEWGSDWKTLTGKAMADFDKQVMDTGFGMLGMFGGGMLGGAGGMLGGGGGSSESSVGKLPQLQSIGIPNSPYQYGPG